MRPVPASVKAARLPQVNLMPPEIGLKRARGQQRAMVALILLLFFVLVAGVGYWVSTVKQDSQRELEAAEAAYTELQTEAARYSAVPLVRQAVANAVDARAYSGVTEMLWVDFLTSLGNAMPGHIEIESVTVNKVSLTSNASMGGGPFARPDIGSVTITAFSREAVDAAEFTERLESLLGIEHVRVTVTTRSLESVGEDSDDDEIVYIIDAQARLTIELLTQRFAPAEADAPSGGGE